VVVVGAGLALSGCGGAGQDVAEPAVEPAPAISVPSDLRMSDEQGVSRSAEKSDEKPEPSSSPSPSEGAVDAERCAELQTAWASTNRALVDLSPEHPRALVESFRAGYRAVTSAEPTEEIAPAWTTMATYLRDAVEAFDGVDEDSVDAVSSAMSDAISADDTARATSAAKDVTEYLSTTCDAR